MNLNNLKSTWKRSVFLNTLDSLNEQFILDIIEQHERYNNRRLPRLVLNASMFIILTACCQGG
ncbi:MAG: hypothetical protein RLO12_04635 [Fulvivirga sp.]|uniref:hypothetical protein n=1 Tax=Fulvivirga sp. TaxID=1931237 RepID=UPI0032F4E9E0